MSQSTPPSARKQAAALLEMILGGRRTLDEALATTPLAGTAPDVSYALLLLHTTLRHLGQIDRLLAGYLAKPLPPKRHAIIHALRLGVVQLLLLDTPAHAAVNESVALVKKGKDAALSGLVNAVLQKIARERPPLPGADTNLPAWIAKRWATCYGADAVATFAAIAAQRPPLDLNTRSDAVGGHRLDADTLRLPADHARVETLSGYEDGAFFVQDIAASYPARLLGEVKGKRVLDLCAAPGGKAAQLARAGAIVTALDRSPIRLERLQENMARLRHTVEVVTADVLQWQPEQPYDAILLDAPCSATGTWRRHPEVVQLVTESDIAELAQLQRQMLTRAWEWLKPGGKLVYCVCSLEREEGEAQAEWFAQTHPDAQPLPIDPTTEILPAAITPQGYLRTLPAMLAEQGGMDGFFAAGWMKA